MHKLRVLLLSTDLEKGGLPLRLVNLARHFPTVDVEPVVGCLAPRGPLSVELEAAGIETFACDAAGTLDLGCFARFAAHVRRIQPDLIHSSLFHANIVARLLGRLDKPRPIITSTVTIEIERRWHRWLESLTAGLSDKHVANSEAVAAHLRDELGFESGKVIVIPNALDFAKLKQVATARREEFGLSDDIPLIVWAGRMDPAKNLEMFVDVVTEVSRHRGIRGLILGDGPQRAKIQARIDEHHANQIIHITGWNESVPAWLKSADVLLFPSWTEGSPNVVLEAMACGCPIVASNIPPIAEMIKTHVYGTLCPPSDRAAFVAAVENVLRDRDQAQSRAKAAQAHVTREHAMESVITRWRKLYDDLMAVSGSVL